MSVLSRITGIHISPKGAHLSTPDPIGGIKEAVSNPLVDAGLALAIPGVGSAIGGALSAIPGASAIGSALSSVPGVSTLGSALGLGGGTAAGAAESAIPDSAFGIGGSGGVSGLLKSAGGFLTGNGGKNALLVAQGINAALQQKKSNELANQALHTAEDRYNAQAPLRAMGLSGLTRPDVGNPYARSA